MLHTTLASSTDADYGTALRGLLPLPLAEGVQRKRQSIARSLAGAYQRPEQSFRPYWQVIAAARTPLASAYSHDKGRNRDERRTVTVLDPADALIDNDWHPHTVAIIQVERRAYIRSAKTRLLRYSAETAFYVANTPVTATRAAEAIGAHWQIENTSHYRYDVTLGEDRSRIRTSPGVFAHLRSFAFNTLKANRTDTLSQDRYRAGLAGIKNLLSLTIVRKR